MTLTFKRHIKTGKLFNDERNNILYPLKQHAPVSLLSKSRDTSDDVSHRKVRTLTESIRFPNDNSVCTDLPRSTRARPRLPAIFPPPLIIDSAWNVFCWHTRLIFVTFESNVIAWWQRRRCILLNGYEWGEAQTSSGAWVFELVAEKFISVSTESCAKWYVLCRASQKKGDKCW